MIYEIMIMKFNLRAITKVQFKSNINILFSVQLLIDVINQSLLKYDILYCNIDNDMPPLWFINLRLSI